MWRKEKQIKKRIQDNSEEETSRFVNDLKNNLNSKRRIKNIEKVKERHS